MVNPNTELMEQLEALDEGSKGKAQAMYEAIDDDVREFINLYVELSKNDPQGAAFIRQHLQESVRSIASPEEAGALA